MGLVGRPHSAFAIEIMKQMRQLFGQQQDVVRRTIESAAAQHVQPLNSESARERT